jgi:hypothetical protein
MSLNRSIADLQKAAIQLYLKLQQRFKENVLIRELWSAMANDLSQQKNSLKALPPSFWNQLQREHIELLQAVVPYARLQVTDNTSDMPLKGCIEGALQFEEPTILKIYIPIIRSLRENLTNPALEFYIMVKAHLARIARMTASFSGDPVIIQRSSLLLQSFEREIQEPPVEAIIPQKKARAKPSAKRSSSAKGRASAERKAAKKVAKPKKARARPAKKRSAARKAAKPKKAVAKKSAKSKKALKQGSALAKSRHHRAKPLAKKVNLRRGRARARR